MGDECVCLVDKPHREETCADFYYKNEESLKVNEIKLESWDGRGAGAIILQWYGEHMSLGTARGAEEGIKVSIAIGPHEGGLGPVVLGCW